MSRKLSPDQKYFPDPVDSEMKEVKESTQLLPELLGLVEGYLAVQKPREWRLTAKSPPPEEMTDDFDFLWRFVLDFHTHDWEDDDSIEVTVGLSSCRFHRNPVIRSMHARLHFLLRDFEEKGWLESRILSS